MDARLHDPGPTLDACRLWLVDEALPLWSGAGFDPASDGFHERLSLHGEPIADVPRRLMVQARQIYVFAHASALGWYPAGRELAQRVASAMVARYWQPDDKPGWAFSVTSGGGVADGRRDTYAHAFVLLALAWAYRVSRERSFIAMADTTLAFLDAGLAAVERGGYETAWPLDGTGREQNPHMHLLEALLALYEATGGVGYLARAGELVGLMSTRFVCPDSGILVEQFDARWEPAAGERGRTWEPGHHFEWSWLLRRYAELSQHDVTRYARPLYERACAQGSDPEGLIIDQVRSDGVPVRRSRRVWPHAEAIKAHAAQYEAGDRGAALRALSTLEVLRARFLQAPVQGGWIDHIDAAGHPLVDDMPASTLYHVFLAFAEVHRVLGARLARLN